MKAFRNNQNIRNDNINLSIRLRPFRQQQLTAITTINRRAIAIRQQHTPRRVQNRATNKR